MTVQTHGIMVSVVAYHGRPYSQSSYTSLSDGRVHEATITKLFPQTFRHLKHEIIILSTVISSEAQRMDSRKIEPNGLCRRISAILFYLVSSVILCHLLPNDEDTVISVELFLHGHVEGIANCHHRPSSC